MQTARTALVSSRTDRRRSPRHLDTDPPLSAELRCVEAVAAYWTTLTAAIRAPGDLPILREEMLLAHRAARDDLVAALRALPRRPFHDGKGGAWSLRFDPESSATIPAYAPATT